MNRRKFLVTTGAAVTGAAAASLLPGCANEAGPGLGAAGSQLRTRSGNGISIVSDSSDAIVVTPQVQWAIDQLRRTLMARGFVVLMCARLYDAGPDDLCLVVAGGNSVVARNLGVAVPDTAEALAIAPGRLEGRDVLLIAGRDVRGLIYALTEINDAVTLADDPHAALRRAEPLVERPANAVRSVTRLFASDVEDKAWFNDRGFWRSYFTMLVAQRFNRMSLALGLGYDAPSGLRDTYFYFAYPFLVQVPGYDVRATNLPDAERDANLAMLRWISDEAVAHGLDFQLGLWTHAYQWTNSPNVNHVIEGLTPRTHGPYCRDALALLLKECPSISGVTMRIHGESGVPEGSYELWGTIFQGCVQSGRRVGLDLHAKGMEQGTLDAAFATGLPITISPKFWAEHLGLPYHQAAIRPTELPQRDRGRGPYAASEGARSFLRYGYGDLLREDRRYAIVHRVWPGTQRVLLWGDPVFAAAYGRAFRFSGSAGVELFDPLSFKGRKGSGLPGGRDGYADLSLRAAGGDFEKFRYGYRLWGRLLFNPDTAPEVWQRFLRRDYGAAAAPAVEASLASAGRILPLLTTAHLPSAANNNFWPEMYVNMSLVDESRPQPYTDTPSPKRFGFVSPLDPQLFARIDDFAAEMAAGTSSGKYSPIEVATWLETFAQTAADQLALAKAKTADARAPAFRRYAIDAEVQLSLGRFFAAKLRAGVLYALFERNGQRVLFDAALAQYRGARQTWAHVVDVTKDVYVHDVSYGEGWFQRGHWADRLAAIDHDIAAVEQKGATPTLVRPLAPEQVAALLRATLDRPQRPAPDATHVPPAGFQRGKEVALELGLGPLGVRPTEARLFYRHLDQAESWQIAPMAFDGDRVRASIPADYTATAYPLEYYFEIGGGVASRPALFPGLGPNLTQQPYFVLR